MEQTLNNIDLNENKIKELKELKESLVNLKIELENIISSL